LSRPDEELAGRQLQAIKDSGKASGFIEFAPRIELLTDHRRVAYTNMYGKVMYFKYAIGTPQLAFVNTPVFRWGGQHLPSMLRGDFPGIAPVRSEVIRGGRPLQTEVYRKDTKSGWSQCEIGYDPTVGYLPRFCRNIDFSTQTNLATVSERYLVDATHCKAGGFVPLVWYYFTLKVRGSDVNDPAYSACMLLSPLKVLHAGHFAVSKFSERTSPVSLEDLSAVRSIAAGPDRFLGRKSFPPKLTLDEIEGILNADLGPSRPSGGTIKPTTSPGVSRRN
jgi:hypothetical protein